MYISTFLSWTGFTIQVQKGGGWSPSSIPHLMGATLSTLLRAVHPGTIAMTDFRQRLRPKVLTRHLGDLWTLHVISCSDEHIVLGIRHYGSIPLILPSVGNLVPFESSLRWGALFWICGPRLLNVVTGGVWDLFVLLPKILGCWGFFARAFLLGRLVLVVGA